MVADLLEGGGLMGLRRNNQVLPEGAGGAGGARPEEEADENMCVICYEDGAGRFVFLECGHGGFCARCAHLLFVRPPNDCPTCRQRVNLVVELESVEPVGQLCKVKVQPTAGPDSPPHTSGVMGEV